MIKIVQVIVAVLLMVAILMQNRGGGLSGLFGGGGGDSGNIYMTKRGFEKKLFVATIVLSVLFFVSSFLSFVL